MLKIENLHVKLEDEDKQILKGVDLEVTAGQVHAIMGPNGSGKSTLSYVLSGREGYERVLSDRHFVFVQRSSCPFIFASSKRNLNTCCLSSSNFW